MLRMNGLFLVAWKQPSERGVLAFYSYVAHVMSCDAKRIEWFGLL